MLRSHENHRKVEEVGRITKMDQGANQCQLPMRIIRKSLKLANVA